MGVGPVGTGLATGIDFASIIEGLIQFESRPVETLQAKIDINTIKQQALDGLNGLALTAKLSLFDFASNSTFDSKTSASSNENILGVTANTTANIGTHNIQLVRLAASQQSISEGIADQDNTTVGTGSLFFEMGAKRLDHATALADLNGGQGIDRGTIIATDSTGQSQEFDLSGSVDMEDVLEIMNANNFGLLAEVNRSYDGSTFSGNGMSIKVTNNGANSVSFSQKGDESTLTDLGLTTTTINAAATQTGSQIYYLTEDSELTKMNDGFGLTTSDSGSADMRFYVADGNNYKRSVEVDLNGSEDVGDVINKINLALQNAALNSFTTASLSSDGLSIQFTGTVSSFSNMNTSRVVEELGLDELTLANSVYSGKQLIADINSSFIRNLHGGNGIPEQEEGNFRITTRNNEEYFINLGTSISVQDVLRVITGTANNGGANKNITASFNDNGTGFKLKDASTGTGTFRVEDLTGNVAKKLGIETTLSIYAANPNVGDTTNASTLVNLQLDPRNSALFLSSNALPQGVTENDLVGRLIMHRYASQRAADENITNNNSSGETGVETAKIIAFEEALDPFSVTALQAASSSATIATGTDDIDFDGVAENVDVLTDATYLDTTNNTSFDKDKIIGSTITVFTTSGSFSSTVTKYDATNKQVTLADRTISTGIGAGNVVQTLGYSVRYNHKLVLGFPDRTTVAGGNTATAAGATFTDANNITVANPQGFDYTRIIGAKLLAFNADGTSNFDIITAYDKTTNTFTLDNDAKGGTVDAVADADIQANGYQIIYNPIQHANHDGGQTFLDDNNGDDDMIHIIGVSGDTVQGDNAENKIMSVNTALSELNGGDGVFKGQILIAAGASSAQIDLNQTKIKTIQDFIDEVESKISSVKVEINDRGDGIRVYDITADQLTTSGINITNVNNGTAAEDMNLLQNLSTTKQTSVTRSTDFASIIGTDISGLSAGTVTIAEVQEFFGLNRNDVIGSKITYTEATSGKKVHAYVTDYESVNDTTNGNHGKLTLTGHVFENSGAIGATNLDGRSISLTLKKHMHYEDLGAATADVTAYDRSTGIGTIDLSTNDSFISLLNEEELVGTLISTATTTSAEANAKSQTAMVTDYNTGTGELTFVAADFFSAAGATVNLSFARDAGSKYHVSGGGMTTSSSFLRNLTTSGFVSASATVDSGSLVTEIKSDDFANLDPNKLIGALITINSAGDSSHNSEVTFVKDYNPIDNTVTINGFYDSSGSLSTSFKLAEGDTINITYRDALQGAVIRSAAPTNFSSLTADANSTRKIIVDSALSGTTFANGSIDMLIGATVTMGTNNDNNDAEKRKIIDVITDLAGTQGQLAIVLDEELPETVVAGEGYTISFEEILGTIEDIDFASGTLHTRDEMIASIGNRDFNIHPVIDGTQQKEVVVESTDTLSDIMTKVNNARVGVTASIIDDGSGVNPFHLSFDSSKTGSSGAVITTSDVRGFSVNSVRKGEDAKLIVGGDLGFSSVVTSDDNTVTDAIQGLTLDLKAASNENVTVTIDHDREGITEKAQEFLDSANSLLQAANELTALEVPVTDENGDPTGETTPGVLFGEFTADSLISTVKSLLTSRVDGLATGEFSILQDVGFSLSADGTLLEFDSSAFDSVLAGKFNEVKNLFTVTPNIADETAFGSSTSMIRDGFDIADITNGVTSTSGYAEGGNGSNGIKARAGNLGDYITMELGETKTLHGMRIYHNIPSDLTATYSISADLAVDGSAAVTNTLGGVQASHSFTDTNLNLVDGANTYVFSTQRGDVTLTFTGANTVQQAMDTWNTANPDNQVSFVSGTGATTDTPGAQTLTNKTYTFQAVKDGTDGNSVQLTFDGSSNVTTLLNNFNSANPSNQMRLVGGTGLFTDVIAAQTISLSGGQNGTDVVTDTTSLGAGAELIKDQLIGSSFTVTRSATVQATGTLTQGANTWTFQANTAGSAGNDILLDFDGSTTVNAAITAWNAANTSNQVTLTAGNGALTPTRAIHILSGGKDSSVSAKITDYDAATGQLKFADNTISDFLDDDGNGTQTITLGYTITSASGTNLSYSYNPVLEYRDPVTGEFVTYREFSNINRERLFVVFTGGLETDALRLSYHNNSGDSEDFTENGFNARVMEVEILDSQGLGAQGSRILDSLTNAQSGLIQTANLAFQDINTTLQTRISSLEERIERTRETLVRQFANLELVVSEISSQSNFLLSQLSSLPSAFSHRR